MNTTPRQNTSKLERVLVPIDFSNDSLNALQVASESFAHSGATLILVNAVETSDAITEHIDLRGQVVNTLVSDAKRQIQSLAATHREKWQEVQSTIELGKPTDVILAAAQAWQADLVVMGSHGKTSLSRALFGGTTYHVARKLSCSVLVLRAGKVA